MKITNISATALRKAPRGEAYWGARTWGEPAQASDDYPPPARRRYVYSATIDTVLVRADTDEGVTGWGECKAPVAATATAAIVTELLAPMVVGTNVNDIAVTWDRMYTAMRVRGHDAGFWLEALSGVDIALWDAWSRTLGQPIHALIGGAYRTEVPVYASGLPAASSDAELDSLRQNAQQLRDAGWTAVKVAIGTRPSWDVASVAAVCDAFETVFADAAGQYDMAQAVRVGRRLEELGVGFFEMPIPPEHVDGYARLAQTLDIPLALDSIPNRYRALEYLRAGALTVLQPDVCRAGGITEVMRISALADAFGAIATPHVSIGSPVHFAASLQCAAAMPNLHVMEHWIGDNPLDVIASDAQPPHQSRRVVTTSPGLGITVDPTKVAASSPPRAH
jgi:D-galactarolactone cycloisomerase